MNACPAVARPAELEPEDLDAAEVASADEVQVEGEAPPPAGPEIREIETLQGRRLRFSVSVDPVIDLERGAVAGHRIEPKIGYEDTRELLTPAARRELLPRDLLEVDVATLERGLTRLQGAEGAAGRASLIVSLSFLTVSSTRARAGLIEALGGARDLLARSAIFEITDFDAGLPSGRLKEACHLIKPFCRSVFAHDTIGSSLGRDARAIGLTGLVYQPPLGLPRAENEAAWLLTAGRSLDPKGGARVAANLSTSQLLSIAAAAGFTHATVRAR